MKRFFITCMLFLFWFYPTQAEQLRSEITEFVHIFSVGNIRCIGRNSIS